jgi:hypothetical protein
MLIRQKSWPMRVPNELVLPSCPTAEGMMDTYRPVVKP